FHSLARSSGVMSCHSWRERPLPGGGWACCWLLGGSVRRSGFFGGVQAAIRSSGDMSRHSLGRMSRSGGRCVVMYCVVGGVFSCTVGGCGGMYGCGWICCCTEGGSAFHASDGMPAGGAEVVECAAGVDEGLVDGCVTGGVAAAGSVGCAWICCCTEGGRECHASDGMPAGGPEGAVVGWLVTAGVGVTVTTGVEVRGGSKWSTWRPPVLPPPVDPDDDEVVVAGLVVGVDVAGLGRAGREPPPPPSLIIMGNPPSWGSRWWGIDSIIDQLGVRVLPQCATPSWPPRPRPRTGRCGSGRTATGSRARPRWW